MTDQELRLRLPDDPMATERCGAWLGRNLGPGDTVALVGPLGAGKTTLVRGLARGLGITDPTAVASPTYLLVVEHQGPVPLLHADAYLPAKLAGFLLDGGLEYLFEPRAVVAVEWADRVANFLPERVLWVTLEPAPDGGRQVGLRPGRPGDFPWLAAAAKLAAAGFPDPD